MNLFDMPEQLSPRLAWMREHGIRIATDRRDAWGDNPDKVWPFHAFVPFRAEAFGDTEDEAIVDLAKQLNLKLWNEQ